MNYLMQKNLNVGTELVTCLLTGSRMTAKYCRANFDARVAFAYASILSSTSAIRFSRYLSLEHIEDIQDICIARSASYTRIVASGRLIKKFIDEVSAVGIY